MWNNLLTVIVLAALIGTFLGFSAPDPRLWPEMPAARTPDSNVLQGHQASEAAVDGPEARKAVAKAAIEANGYLYVTVVGRSADGRWRAKAWRGMEPVAVIVDEAGRVSEE
jgi:hypothetical protein